MTRDDERDALARVIYEADNGPKHSCDSESFDDTYQRPWLARADAVLSSDWLKALEAAVAAAALRDAADEYSTTYANATSVRDWLRTRADESNPR